MKQILLSILLILSINIYSQKVTPKAAFDWYPAVKFLRLGNSSLNLGRFRTRMGLEVSKEFKLFNKDLKIALYNDNHIYMNYWSKDKNFEPRVAEFYTGGYIQFKEIKLTYEHLCIHPLRVNRRDDIIFYGGHDMISLSYNY